MSRGIVRIAGMPSSRATSEVQGQPLKSGAEVAFPHGIFRSSRTSKTIQSICAPDCTKNVESPTRSFNRLEEEWDRYYHGQARVGGLRGEAGRRMASGAEGRDGQKSQRSGRSFAP